jgi:hypothetical protein
MTQGATARLSYFMLCFACTDSYTLVEPSNDHAAGSPAAPAVAAAAEALSPSVPGISGTPQQQEPPQQTEEDAVQEAMRIMALCRPGIEELLEERRIDYNATLLATGSPVISPYNSRTV